MPPKTTKARPRKRAPPVKEQDVLDAISKGLAHAIENPEFDATLQRIKGHFFNREYDAVFAEPTHLPVYAARYTPPRALAYLELIRSQPDILDVLRGDARIFSLGAGAGAELVAFLAASRAVTSPQQAVTLHTQDYVRWDETLDALEESCCKAWPIEEGRFRTERSVGDLLACPQQIQEELARADLVTAMFVLNEIFGDKAAAMRVIKMLTDSIRPGSLLLIVDSAGSFSHIKMGERTYMLYMFFDALKAHFEPVISENSVWYRPDKTLGYPLEIENMRYFIRLYRRKA